MRRTLARRSDGIAHLPKCKARAMRLLALLCAVLGMASAMLSSSPAPASATVPGVDSTTLVWSTSNRVYYGNYNTPIFTTVDTAGKVLFAYCVDPTTTVPTAGSYATISVPEFNPYWAAQIRAAMWFSYGGPGFDPAMWPSTWNDGSAMDAAQYYAAAHLILTYATTQNLGYVYYNAGSNFINYAAQTFLGVDLHGNTVNASSTMFQMFARANEVPESYNCYYLDCGAWDYTQYVIGQDYYVPPAPPVQTGSLALKKESADPDITNANPCYSLEGAAFGVYADQACTQFEVEIVLDASAQGSVAGLPAGTHWIKETRAPQGYALNETVYEASVPAGESIALTVRDDAQFAPIELVVTKVDGTTGSVAQGNATLAGAEFSVRYYAGTYGLDNLPSQPTRSWTITTDEQGRGTFASEHLIGGDEPYRNAAGEPVLPLGTVVIAETKPPAGYRLDDAGDRLIVIAANESAGRIASYEAPTVGDSVKRGGVSVQKVDSETALDSPQGAASFAGAQFSVVSLNQNPVVVDGAAYSSGETVASLVTDNAGYAATASDALPYGAYRVSEVQPPTGYLLSATQWDVQVQGEGIVAVGEPASQRKNDTERAPIEKLASEPVVAEQVIRGGIRAYKVDADTGTGSAQGDASLEGTEFSIISLNDGPVLVDGTVYKNGDVVKKIYTDASGMAQTGERDLPFGIYTVTETQAPPGYLRSIQTVSIEQDGVIVVFGKEFQNDVQRGSIIVKKIDADLGSGQSQGNATLAGTEFSIINASAQTVMVDDVLYEPGETVLVIATNKSGVAQTDSYALPFGTYTVVESKAPAGYQEGDGTIQTVSITANGQVCELESAFANNVKRGGLCLDKLDQDTGAPSPQGGASLAGATFNVHNITGSPVVVNGTTYQPGELVMTIQTDETGHAETGAHDLPCGTYAVTEASAPEGYLINPETQTVQIQEEGVIVSVATPFVERVARGGLGLRKLDAETSQATPQGMASLAGAKYEIVNANEHSVVVQGGTYEAGAIVMVIETNADGWAQTGNHDLPYGTYTVREAAAPSGYHCGLTDENGVETGEAREITISIDGDWSWHSFESNVYDQVIRGGIALEKVDPQVDVEQSQGSATLEGARFEITNASDHAVLVNGASYGTGEVVATLVTDAAGHAATGPRALPFGRYTVAEVEAPQGYLLDGTPQTVVVAEEGAVVQVAQSFTNQVKRGGVSVQKADVEIGAMGPQGSATYEGAAFSIVNTSPRPVLVDGVLRQPQETVAVIKTDKNGFASTGSRALPYGTYFVQETAAPAGYLVNETAWEITIAEDSAIVQIGSILETPQVTMVSDVEEPDAFNPFEAIASLFSPQVAQAAEAQTTADGDSPVTPIVPENVIRGGVAIQKADAQTEDGSPQGDASLAGTVFAVTTLNENPVLVHGALYAKGDVVMTLQTNDEGIAASGATDLPYGTYQVCETTAPKGYLPGDSSVVQTFIVAEEGEVVLLPEPFKNTVARGGLSLQKIDAYTESNQSVADGTLTGASFAIANASNHKVIVHETPYEPGEVVMTLVTDQEGRASTGPHDLPYGTYSVSETKPPEGYTIDSEDIQTVVIDQDGIVVPCEHAFKDRIARGDVAGIKIEDETGAALPHVAFLITSLTTKESHVVVADDSGRFSTASSAVPHSQSTNGNDAAVDDKGIVVDETVLSPTNGIWFSGSPSMDVGPNDGLGALPFDKYRFDELPTTASYGHDPISFEVAVREEGVVVDIGEVGNHIIQLHTTARIASTESNEGPAESKSEIVDVVAYAGLAVGTTYEFRAELVDRATGETLIDGEGLSPTATVSFVAEQSEGTVEASIPLDASTLAGTRAVVFERLYLNGQEIASHADIADDDQTVSFVDIGTTATGKTSGTHEEQVSKTTSIVDTVSYRGLAPGRDYTLEGVLIDREAGTPCADGTGNELRVSHTFTPDSSSGTTQVEFCFDASHLAGTTVVAYETLRHNETVIATHEDIADSEQAVAFIDIKTTATNKETGTHTAQTSEATSIIDIVSYQGLAIGESYTVEGVLVNRENGTVLVDLSGRPLASSATFQAEAAQGTVEVEFAFDASNLQGCTVVVFENLLRNNVVVASHVDLNDEGQTVAFVAPNIPKTGQDDWYTPAIAVAVAGSIATVSGALLVLVRRSRTLHLAAKDPLSTNR